MKGKAPSPPKKGSLGKPGCGGGAHGAPHSYRFRSTHDARRPPIPRLVLATTGPRPSVGRGVSQQACRHAWRGTCTHGAPHPQGLPESDSGVSGRHSSMGGAKVPAGLRPARQRHANIRSYADLNRDRWIQSPECWPLHHRTDWPQQTKENGAQQCLERHGREP